MPQKSTSEFLMNLINHAREFGTPQTSFRSIDGKDFFGLEVFVTHLSYAIANSPLSALSAVRFSYAGKCYPLPVVVDSAKFIAERLGEKYLLRKVDQDGKEEELEIVEANEILGAEQTARMRLNILATQYEEQIYRFHRDLKRNQWILYHYIHSSN